MSKYEVCHQCENPIEITGLDGFKCSKCGWVRRPKNYEDDLRTDESNRNNGRKRKTISRMPETSRRKYTTIVIRLSCYILPFTL
jgi:tRNA(Ile2) C34 agmatinyltransferase TiaS